MQFHHLHGHSYFSNGNAPDALSSPADLVKAAVEKGLPSICITDHASIMGAPVLFREAREAGIKPIIGTELYVTNDLTWRPADKTDKSRRKYKHLVALAKNWQGVIEIMDLLTTANQDDHFYFRPRNHIDEVAATENILFTTACAGGLLADEDAEQDLMTLLRAGRDVWLEIQPHIDEGQWSTNCTALHFHNELGLPLVATQDFHYAREGQNIAHEVLLASGQRKTWSSPDRWKYPVSDLFIKDANQMVEAFGLQMKRFGGTHTITPKEVIYAMQQTAVIADQCNVEWQKIDISLPVMSENPERTLMEMCVEQMKARGFMSNPEYVERLKYEFAVMQESGFLTYFLVLADIIAWCRKENIQVGPGRGSSAGSLICYLIGITQVDPIIHGLLFERFYRPGRVDLPDIDTDFEDERRDEVITYIRERFGSDYVAGVANYMTLGVKGAIKDVARVFEIDHRETNMATSPVPDGADDDDAWLEDSLQLFFKKYPLVEPQARALVGTMKGMGQHAAGIVIAGVPLRERTVVWRKDERNIACWDKRIIEDMGLMKLDVLGLRTLSILRNAASNVFKHRGVKVDFESIPLDDEKALEIFQKGHTTGVFQFESPGMRALLKSLKVNQFSIIADATSLYRPGPMDLIPQYTIVQTGRVPASYDHDLLEPILKDTFGVFIYQEQLMKCMSEIGGYTYAEADTMRKIVGKKLGEDEFRKHKESFVEGAMAGYVEVETDDGRTVKVHKKRLLKVKGTNDYVTIEQAARDDLDVEI